ncbi:heme exporter protein A [Ardenticatena maritima]|uniref:Heme exporter protein A n=1 Tax=Ardenticatena maritima TaxID=872965 RepID=A0A0M8K4Y2_9CHLR|nr:heme ABC exporter ATP-binding protein CcmA [Ardenticatena maritima]KPL88486.1 hypothetical protein SE16_06755 [Ardenticatena maritima]GAP61685.1 heme exporter protein A [Ardenticatena maritima]
MIEIENLHKQFGHHRVLRGINLTIAQGQFLTLFGPNGAGKTTLLKIIATLSRPTRGCVRLNGYELRSDWTEARRAIGMVSHQSLLYPDLTLYENLRFFAQLYALPDPDNRIRHLLDEVGLAHRAHDAVRTFSRGMIQRATIARALLHDPLILLLDEPFTGLDEGAAERFGALLAETARRGRTIIMTTHNLEQGLALGDHIAILAGGKIVHNAPREAHTMDEWRTLYRRYVGGAHA